MLSTFRSNEDSPPRFSVVHSVEFGQVMFKYNLYPIHVLLLLTNLIYIKSFYIAIIIK